MSYKAVMWAGSIAGLKPPEAFVLARIADQASDEGLCSISYRSLAETTRYNRRHVIRLVQRLKELHLLVMTDQHNAKSLHLPKQILLNYSAGGGSDKMSLAGSDKMSLAGSDKMSPPPEADLTGQAPAGGYNAPASLIKTGKENTPSQPDPASRPAADLFIDLLRDAWVSEIGPLNPGTEKRIALLAADIPAAFPKDWINKAFQEAVLKNSRQPWSYVEAIIRSCIDQRRAPGATRMSRGAPPVQNTASNATGPKAKVGGPHYFMDPDNCHCIACATERGETSSPNRPDVDLPDVADPYSRLSPFHARDQRSELGGAA